MTELAKSVDGGGAGLVLGALTTSMHGLLIALFTSLPTFNIRLHSAKSAPRNLRIVRRSKPDVS